MVRNDSGLRRLDPPAASADPLNPGGNQISTPPSLHRQPRHPTRSAGHFAWLPSGPITLLLLVPRSAFAQEPIYGVGSWTVPEEAALAGPPIQERLLRWGPLQVRPQADVSAFYDSNISLRPEGRAQADWVFALSPGLTLGLGDVQEKLGNVIVATYVPTIALYARNDEYDGVDHNLSVLGRWRAAKVTVSLEQDYQAAEGGVRDVADRAAWQIYTTRLLGRYFYSDRTTFGLNAVQSINDWDTLISYNEWRVDAYADYALTPKVTTGLDVGLTYRTTDQNPDMFGERVAVRAGYQLTEKVLLNSSVGVECRQYDGGQNEDPDPVLSLGAAYQVLPRTTLTLEAHRHSEASVNPGFVGQVVEVTGVALGLRQGLWTKFTANLSAGYEFADYGAVSAGVDANRQDDYVLVRAALEYALTDKFALGAFYTFRQNASTFEDYEFVSHQIGLRVSYRF